MHAQVATGTAHATKGPLVGDMTGSVGSRGLLEVVEQISREDDGWFF